MSNSPIDYAGILKQYMNAPDGKAVASAEDDFNQAVYMSPRDDIGQALAAAFRSDQTPPPEQMVSQLFGRSNPLQQAGLLNQLIRTLGPVVLASIAGKVFSGMKSAPPNLDAGVDRSAGQSAGPSMSPSAGQTSVAIPPPQITPQQAQEITQQQVSDITKQAAEKDPTILDQLGRYYAQHPDLVKTLGGAALTIALAKIAQGMRGR